MLQHVPDDALIGYVKNPDGQVPSYLALAEISRRKEVRNNAAPQQAQAPKQTVVDQELAAVEPGVASLPVPDHMFQEKSMAAGGIVAFANNKDQPVHVGMPGSGLETLSLDELSLLTDQAEAKRREEAMAEYFRLHANDKPNTSYPGTADKALSTYRAPGAGLYPNFQANRQEVIGDPRYQNRTLSPFGFGNDVSVLQNIRNNTPINLPPQAAAPNTGKDVDTVYTPPPKPDLPTAPVLGGINFNLPNRLAGVTVPDAVKLNREDFVGEAPTLAGIQALRKEAYGKAGVSEKPYEKMLSDIGQQREDIEGKGKDKAIADFMMQLGFGAAAGKSQNWLQNVGEAASVAGKGLSESMDRLEAKRDKLNEREFAVMEAQNRFRQTGADSDLKSLTDKQAAYDVARRDYAKTDAQLQDTHQGRQFSLATAQAQEAGQTDRAILNAKLQEQQLKVSSFNAETQRLIYNKPDFFGTILGYAQADEDFNKLKPMEKIKYLDSIVEKQGGASGDNTLRQKAGDSVDKVLEGANPIARQWKNLLKEDPTGVKAAAFKDNLVRQEILRRKQDVMSSSTSSADPLGIL